jgi:uncharacterized damage-inducible protein DinB
MKKMKRVMRCAVVLVVLGTGVTGASAQAGDVADHTAPSYDMKGQSLADLQVVQNKMVALVNAIPADKMTWRPSPDSRSFAEVFLHVAGERYQILGLGGAVPPANFDGKTYEKSTTDKAQLVAELNRTWDFAQKTINAMSNADFAKPVPKLGPEANAGDVVYILVADAHEHLGQLVAYARENGIVPPWTAAAQKEAAQKKAEEKKAP